MGQKIATRDAYGQALVKLGRENPNVVVLDADLSKSTKT
ncbi:MAG: transketolase family protein, partial [Firmicutes bacterium]|nr:transketolase family protein [Bacillota bacterium]